MLWLSFVHVEQFVSSATESLKGYFLVKQVLARVL